MGMMPSDLATFLGRDVDYDRANLMLSLASELCSTVVTPVPDTARSVILDVAARAYANISAATQMGLGSGQISFGSGPSGGLWLTRANIAALRRAAGKGGAFSVDPTPADAGQGLPAHDVNTTWLAPVPPFSSP